MQAEALALCCFQSGLPMAALSAASIATPPGAGTVRGCVRNVVRPLHGKHRPLHPSTPLHQTPSVQMHNVIKSSAPSPLSPRPRGRAAASSCRAGAGGYRKLVPGTFVCVSSSGRLSASRCTNSGFAISAVEQPLSSRCSLTSPVHGDCPVRGSHERRRRFACAAQASAGDSGSSSADSAAAAAAAAADEAKAAAEDAAAPSASQQSGSPGTKSGSSSSSSSSSTSSGNGSKAPSRRDASNNNRQGQRKDSHPQSPWQWLSGFASQVVQFVVFMALNAAAFAIATRLMRVRLPSLNFVNHGEGRVSIVATQKSSNSEAETAAAGRRRGGAKEGAQGKKGETGLSSRRIPRLVTGVSVPFSEFLFHVKKDNVAAVTVDGDRVSFVLRNADLIPAGHQAAQVLPDVRQCEQIVLENRRMMAEGGGGGGEASKGKEREKDKGWNKAKQGPLLQIELKTVRPADLALPYAELSARNVEFGTSDKMPSVMRMLNQATTVILYAGLLAAIISRLPFKMPNRIGGRRRGGKGKGPGVLFADVAGVDEAKEELEEIVEYLRMPERFTRLGARPPRGVLLVGPPGTGKTMLAKAVAGEADVQFVSCSGSEFVELYVGLGASRVRELFAQAKKDAPSIIFIDEIDSVAKVRDGRSRNVGNDEREQTLNQLLTEMDGFDSSTAVIVLAATNRADVLDPALRRPGRFDRIVAVEPPDRQGREAILSVHMEKKELPLADDVNVHDIATATTGFTGADLANLVNEAALLAARDDECDAVAKIHFEKAVERSLAGVEKKRNVLGSSEKGVVARHEVGHALLGAAVAKLLPHQPIVQKISIIPRSGGALGFAYMPPPPGGEERQLLFTDEVRGRLVGLLGGRAAEEVVFAGRVSTGAMDDIRRATDLAYKAVAEFGLSTAVGPLSLGTLAGGGLEGGMGGFPWGSDQQGRLAESVQSEVQNLLQESLAVARVVVERNLSLLHELGAKLEEDESLEGEMLRSFLERVDPTLELRTFLESSAMTTKLLPPGVTAADDHLLPPGRE